MELICQLRIEIKIEWDIYRYDAEIFQKYSQHTAFDKIENLAIILEK